MVEKKEIKAKHPDIETLTSSCVDTRMSSQHDSESYTLQLPSSIPSDSLLNIIFHQSFTLIGVSLVSLRPPSSSGKSGSRDK